MPLADRGRNAKLCSASDLIRLKDANHAAQFLHRNRADNTNRVGKGPVILAGIMLRDLCVNRLNIPATKKASQNFSKAVHSGMLHEIAANRAKVVIAIEESLDVDNLWLRLRS